MTLSALIMLLVSWAVISSLTAWFFWRVLRTPQRDDPDLTNDGAAGHSPHGEDA